MSSVSSRLSKLQERLGMSSLDGILVTHLTHVRYLSGFTGSAGTCLMLPDKGYFFSDGRYLTQSKRQVKEMEIIIGSGSHLKLIHQHHLLTKNFKLAFEADYVSVSFFHELGSLFPNIEWVSTSRLVEELSAVKEESEIRAIQSAVEITDEAFTQIVPELRAGVTERVISAKLSYLLEMLGSHGVAFPPIVASGPNSALPHAVPTDRTFQNGDFVVLDFGAVVEGYHADMTRTVVIKTATERHRGIYEVVRESQQKGCEQAKAGMSCKDLDSVTRGYISDKGYGDYFVHGTGHGLGLEIHTLPRISQESDEILLENYVVTVEPGIYIPDWGGVRIEDDVVIKNGCAQLLNQSTKEMLVVA